MNSVLQIQTPAPGTPDLGSQTTSPPTDKRSKTKRSRNGKVARLPHELRNSICLMMQDGLSSRAIIQKLGPDAKDLRQRNLSEWKRGGFIDWQRENLWQAELKAQQQFALQLLLTNDQTKLPHVVLQIAATQIFQALRKIAPDNFTGKFDADASSYTRLLNSLARISRSSLVFTKYSDLRADLKEHQPRLLDPKQKILDEQCAALATLLDRHFIGSDYQPPTAYVTPPPQDQNPSTQH